MLKDNLEDSITFLSRSNFGILREKSVKIEKKSKIIKKFRKPNGKSQVHFVNVIMMKTADGLQRTFSKRHPIKVFVCNFLSLPS